MSNFKELESFKHKCAKELLYKWLREDKNYNYDKWEDNNAVKLEYPLVVNNYNNTICSFSYCTDFKKHKYYKQLNFSPTYQDCIKVNDIPIKVVDIAKTYKGTVDEIFEVYYKNRISKYKLEKIKKYVSNNTKLYEISADKILSLCNKPNNIYANCEQLI